MSPTEFCYWLQGMLEIGKPVRLDPTQVETIREHLNLVFKNVTGAAPAVDEPPRSPRAPSSPRPRDRRLCSGLDPNTKYC